MEWRVTNYREQHVREDGKIIGKIYRVPSDLSVWYCLFYGTDLATGKSFKTDLGTRKSVDSARKVVERAAAKEKSVMINEDELAICRRRRHEVRPTTRGWTQCPACGMWLREKVIIEERLDEPPEDELDPGIRTDRRLVELQRKFKSREGQVN